MSVYYTKSEERTNCISHILGVIIAVIAGAVFLPVVYTRYDALAQLGIWLYLFGILSSYGASSLYHGSKPDSAAKIRFRKLDHAAIYWHIAGSYSPICLIGMRGDMFWGWFLFILVWFCALVGSLTTLRKLEDHSYLETFCFVAMGLAVLIAFKPVQDSIGWHAMGWIIAEGVMFVIGAVFYSLIKIRFMHTIFHIFVLLGSICHIVAIWYIL